MSNACAIRALPSSPFRLSVIQTPNIATMKSSVARTGWYMFPLVSNIFEPSLRRGKAHNLGASFRIGVFRLRESVTGSTVFALNSRRAAISFVVSPRAECLRTLASRSVKPRAPRLRRFVGSSCNTFLHSIGKRRIDIEFAKFYAAYCMHEIFCRRPLQHVAPHACRQRLLEEGALFIERQNENAHAGAFLCPGVVPMRCR